MQRIVRRAVVAAVPLVGSAILLSCGGAEEPAVADIETPRSGAANGIDDLEPDEALEEVHEALEAAGTFSVKGLMLNGSELDISFDVGVGVTGTIRDPQAETPVEILAVDNSIYVTGDEQLLAKSIGEDIDDTVAGKWLKLDTAALKQYEVFTDAESFVDAVLPTNEPMTVTGVRELRGLKVVGLMFEESDSIVWVAAKGEPVPVQLEEKGASADTGVLRFAVPGGEMAIIAPAKEEIVTAETPGESKGESDGDSGGESDGEDSGSADSGDGGGSDG